MAKHKWKFKAHFRTGAYGWKGTALASKRMREAVSEIKKAARADSALAGEGAIELMCRLYPACEHIDGSSGSLGTALNRTIAALVPIVAKADWDMNTRGKLLEDLYEAVCNDGWSILSEVEDHWGEICVYPGLANLWADRLVPFLRDVWSSESRGYVTGDGACMSCLLYTHRYDELEELIALDRVKLWSNAKFWAAALVQQGKVDEAVAYAESIRDLHEGRYDNHSIDEFCEETLLEAGRAEEAYTRYGLRILGQGTYVSVYRHLVRKYPHRDARQILLDLMGKSGEKGKWFAAAKDAGFLDVALACARSGGAEPSTLLRATRDFAEKDPHFAVDVGIESIKALLSGMSYELPTGLDVAVHYEAVMAVACQHGMQEQAKAELARAACSPFGDRLLREALMRKLLQDSPPATLRRENSDERPV
ncbi:hypothetical protein [Anaerobaca lacustris]|uniref:Uncharacterized protein n=1 Tax=Anaerobaca lacustris TaxID=3044600 RepID=A0AAW6U5W5_9BACT|nr:hypothetical protein [Sedimentisphaerales bacterium M17dextr]